MILQKYFCYSSFLDLEIIRCVTVLAHVADTEPSHARYRSKCSKDVGLNLIHVEHVYKVMYFQRVHV